MLDLGVLVDSEIRVPSWGPYYKGILQVGGSILLTSPLVEL